MPVILVVEDDRLLRKAIKEELEESNFKVVVAETADETFRQLRETEVDLIYLDIMIPGDVDGYGVLRKLKAEDSEFKKIPVVMLSNLGQLDEIDSAMQLGATDYVVKASINLPRLVEITREKLGYA